MKKLFLLFGISTAISAFAQDAKSAQNCFDKNDFRCSAEQFKILADKETNSTLKSQYLNGLGLSLRRIGKTQEAFKALENAVKANPQYAKSYINLAQLHSQKGVKQKALEYISQGLIIEPENAELFATRAKVYEDLGKNDLAEKDYQQAINVSEDQVLAKSNYAIFKKNTGKLDDALKDYNAMIAEKPQSLLYISRADVYRKMKKNKEAMADVTKAISLDPKFGPSYAMKAQILSDTPGKEKETCENANKAVSLGYDKFLIGEILKKCTPKN